LNWTLEVVIVPVSDVDRAKEFYTEKLGFHVDHDARGPEGYGPVQLTPPGSGCSIVIGNGLTDAAPGSAKLQLVVPDLHKAHAQLLERGLEVGEIQLMGPTGMRPATEEDSLDNMGFVFFADPDGNGWAVQQISSRG
jgi:catechol 2,3-dioxygenase-like lactoylglutathione lyase family enzyme